MITKRTAFIVILLALAGIGAVLYLKPSLRQALLGKGEVASPGAQASSLSPSDRALLATLNPEEQRKALESFEAARAAARAAGKEARLADFMPETAFSVTVAEARRATLRPYIDVSGDVQAATSVEAYPDIAGRIASVSVSLGDYVAKGQVIAQVDPSLPGSVYALSSVIAPISGTITDLPKSVGDKVSVSTAIATVGILSRLEVRALIPERDVGALRAGQRALLRFEAFPGRSFEARVSRLSPVLDKASRTMAATIAVDPDGSRLAPGMYARVRIFTASFEGVVAVPEGAVFDRFGEACVYIVDRREDGDRARLAKIERGVAVDGLVEARKGVAEGDRVVVAGRAALGDGALVRVVSGASAGAGTRANGGAGGGDGAAARGTGTK